ncbi:hypothetical protein BST61_g899 [Cercospora zeina]
MCARLTHHLCRERETPRERALHLDQGALARVLLQQLPVLYSDFPKVCRGMAPSDFPPARPLAPRSSVQ